MQIEKTETIVSHMKRAYKRVTNRFEPFKIHWYVRDMMTGRWVQLKPAPNARLEFDRLEDLYQNIIHEK